MGFATTFRFGAPFFLEPTIDEVLLGTDVKDNFRSFTAATLSSLVANGCTLSTINVPGFFNRRYF